MAFEDRGHDAVVKKGDGVAQLKLVHAQHLVFVVPAPTWSSALRETIPAFPLFAVCNFKSEGRGGCEFEGIKCRPLASVSIPPPYLALLHPDPVDFTLLMNE